MIQNNTEETEEAKKGVRQIIHDLKKIHADLPPNNQDVGLLAIIGFLVSSINKATTPAQVKMLQLIASAARSSIILGKSLKESLAIEQAKIIDTANSPDVVKENLIFALGSLALTLEKEGYEETALFLRKMQKVIEEEVDLSNESADRLRNIENHTNLLVFDILNSLASDILNTEQDKSTNGKNFTVIVKDKMSGLLKYLRLVKETASEENRENELGKDEQAEQEFSNWSEEKSQDETETLDKSQKTQENKNDRTETSGKVGGDNMSPSTSCQPKQASSFKVLCNILHYRH